MRLCCMPSRGAAFALLALLMIAGCDAKTAPVLTPETALGQTTPYSEQQVEAAVLEGLAHKGWMLVDREPGEVTAEIARDKNLAKINVQYSDKGWLIQREDTTDGLLFEAGDANDPPRIHKRYNLWVQKLDEEIRSSLSRQLAAAKTHAVERPEWGEATGAVKASGGSSKAAPSDQNQPAQEAERPVPAPRSPEAAATE